MPEDVPILRYKAKRQSYKGLNLKNAQCEVFIHSQQAILLPSL
jgi:hypothetical protein